MFIRILLLSCCVAWLGVVGCARFQKQKKINYQTVEASSIRDSEKARKQNELGLKKMEQGKLGKAETHFQKALVADVDFGPAHNNLGKLYFQRKMYYLAAWEFEHARRVMPGRSEPHNNLGLVYEAVSRPGIAIEHYQQAYQLSPKSPELIGNLVRVRLQQGLHDVETRRLLEDLLLYDTRPDWVSWARRQLEMGKLPRLDDPPERVDNPDLSKDANEDQSSELPTKIDLEELLQKPNAGYPEELPSPPLNRFSAPE